MKFSGKITALLVASAAALCAGCSAPAASSAASQETPQADVFETRESASQETDAPDASDNDSDAPRENAIGRYLEGRDTFEVTSEDLVDGVWPDIISYTHIGENKSPQLSWTPVEGAGSYVIYMVDCNTNGFLHWKSNNVTETMLPQGWAPAVDYTGPHIGHGYTHDFEIYVMALKTPADRLKGAVNAVNAELGSFIEEIDTGSDGSTGNIIAYGKISGKFTDARFRGDRTVDEDRAYYM